MSHVYTRHLSPLRASVAIVAVLVVASQACVASSVKNDRGTISVLSMGAGLRSLMHEPFLEVNPVLGFRGWYPVEVIQRSVRLYMPRTYQELIGTYDVIGLHYTEPKFFTARMIKWLSDSALEGGRGLAFYGHGAWFYPWLDTTVVDVSPVEKLEDFEGKREVWIRIRKPENPLIASLPWSEMGMHGCFVRAQGVKAKIGAEVLAEKVPMGFGTATPFLTWWEVGTGRCLAITPYYASVVVGNNPFTSWEYYPDFVRNYHLYLAEREIPPDPEILHRITLTLDNCHFLRTDLVSMIEFISSLGGNPRQLDKRLNLADEKLKEVDRRYLEYEFESSLSVAQDLLADLKGNIDLAMDLKDQTMFWIYLIEWTVLTSTAVLAGTVVWTLMMRRSLYKKVRITKLDRLHTPE